MKQTLISYQQVSMGTKKAREKVDGYRAVYAALHSLLDACVITDGRIEREFTQVELHRWCSTAGQDMNSVPVVARWFRDLMAHITHSVRFQLDVMEKSKGSAITTLDGLKRFIGEVEAISIPSFYSESIKGLVLLGQARFLTDDEHKRFMLTGDRKDAKVVHHFDNCNIYMRNLISAIVLMELHRNAGYPVRRNRGETDIDWFTRVEEHMGARSANRARSDKPSKLPRKGNRVCH